MLALQREQFHHDERFHREIARLTVHERLSHMALHFCKYTGQFAQVCVSQDSALRARTIVDSLIICLSTANTLNLDLSVIVPLAKDTDSLHASGMRLAQYRYPSVIFDDNWLLVTYADQVGKLARACEKVDHLEPFPFRETIIETVTRICEISLIAATINGIEITSAIGDRRKEIRGRNPFIASITARS